MDVQTPTGDEEAERLRQLISALFGSRVREFLVLVRGGGLVLQGKAGSFYLKQMVQETALKATAFRVVANEIAVDWTASVGPPDRCRPPGPLTNFSS